MWGDLEFDDVKGLMCANLPDWCQPPLEGDDFEGLLPEQIIQLLDWKEKQLTRLKRRFLKVKEIASPHPMYWDGDGLMFYF